MKYEYQSDLIPSVEVWKIKWLDELNIFNNYINKWQLLISNYSIQNGVFKNYNKIVMLVLSMNNKCY